MDYKDLTKEQVQELKGLLEIAERDNSESIVFGGVELDLEYANLLYAICINDEQENSSSITDN